MATLSDLKGAQSDAIRKAVDLAVITAPMTASIPTAWTATSSATLIANPTGFKPLGLITKDDGVSFGRDVSVEETTSYGVVTPTRSDIVSDTTTLSFTCQQTDKTVLENYYGVDLSSVTPTATTGEIAFSQPLSPTAKFSRVVVIAADGSGSDLIYVIKILARAQLTEFGEQQMTDSSPILYPMTFTATPDNTAGYAVRHVFGGPGWISRLATMGFPALS